MSRAGLQQWRVGRYSHDSHHLANGSPRPSSSQPTVKHHIYDQGTDDDNRRHDDHRRDYYNHRRDYYNHHGRDDDHDRCQHNNNSCDYYDDHRCSASTYDPTGATATSGRDDYDYDDDRRSRAIEHHDHCRPTNPADHVGGDYSHIGGGDYDDDR